MPCRLIVGWPLSELTACRCSAAVWLETGSGIRTLFRLARRGVTYPVDVRRLVVFTIGIDPHKGSHLAAVLDEHEIFVEELRVRADRHQRERLLKFAAPYTPRVWAIEGARGLGALLAQQLVGSGETVLDVPAKLSARVRVLDNECADKNDSHDARSAAIVGIRNRRLVVVTPEDHAVVLRMLAKRHHDLTGRRTQSICRLHALLATMTAGGLPRLLSADRAARELRRIRPTDAVGLARRHAAVELLSEVRDSDKQLVELRKRIVAAVRVANTTVTNVYGVGPIVAAYVIGYTGDVKRFATSDRYARYNATAPLNASSGPNPRHRLNNRGNRQLNHAIHIAAVTQLSHDTAGRDYYQRKQAERHSDKEALRALKRRISDAIYARLRADAQR
jgi:transposase